MKKLFIAIMVLAAIAFGNAVYLTTQAYTLKTQLAESAGSYASFCDINSTFSCSNVLLSPRAQFFGFPFPALAMVVYPVIFLIALLGYLGICRKAFSILAGIAVGGMCFNGYYIYQEAFHIGSFCPLCLACSVIIITIFGLSIIGFQKKSLTK
ncbi:MAG: vitamin K epoxide reductase family protein [Candidatus Gracilibacteria bacterium]